MLKRIFTVLALVCGMATMVTPTITLAAQITPSHGKLQVIDSSQLNPGDSPVVPDNQGNAGYGNIAPVSPGDDNSTNSPGSDQSPGDNSNSNAPGAMQDPGSLSDPNAGVSPGLTPPDDNSATPSPTDASPTSSDPNTSVDNSSE